MTGAIGTKQELKQHLRKMFAEHFPDMTAAQLYDEAQRDFAMRSATKSPSQRRAALATYLAAAEAASSDDPPEEIIKARAREFCRALSEEDIDAFAALGLLKFLADEAEDLAPKK